MGIGRQHHEPPPSFPRPSPSSGALETWLQGCVRAALRDEMRAITDAMRGVVREELRQTHGHAAEGTPPDELLTVTQVAEELHVTAPTVRQWVKSRRLPAVRKQRLIRVRRSELARFLLDLGEDDPPDPADEAREVLSTL